MYVGAHTAEESDLIAAFLSRLGQGAKRRGRGVPLAIFGAKKARLFLGPRAILHLPHSAANSLLLRHMVISEIKKGISTGLMTSSSTCARRTECTEDRRT